MKLICSLRLLFSQDGYYSHRPKEKVRVDSNNENSVPKDFENIDNSNFGARSQPQRQPPGGADSNKRRERLQEKAHAEQATWKDNVPIFSRSSNEVLQYGRAVAQNGSLPVGPKAVGAGVGSRNHHSRSSQPQSQGQAQTYPQSQSHPQTQHRHQHPHQTRKQATAAPLEVVYDQPPKCEISGKEAISALSRAKTKVCRQQIAEVYCRHKEGQLMPEKVTRYCPIEGELIHILLLYHRG